MNQLQIITSQKGGQKLLLNGFSYTVKTKSKHSIRWECSERRSSQCEAKLTTKLDDNENTTILSQTGILSPGILSPWDSVFQGFSFLLGFCLTGFLSDWDYISLGLCLTGIISHWDFVIPFPGILSYWDNVLLGLCHRLTGHAIYNM